MFLNASKVIFKIHKFKAPITKTLSNKQKDIVFFLLFTPPGLGPVSGSDQFVCVKENTAGPCAVSHLQVDH